MHLNCLSEVEIHSPSQQVMLWNAQKETYQRTTCLVTSLGKPSITAPQAKRLDFLGFTTPSLLQLYTQAESVDDFTQVLKAKGVHSKALRGKLALLLESKAKANSKCK